MKPFQLNPKEENFVTKNQLANTLISPNNELEDDAQFTNPSGRKFYVPRYRLAAQSAGGVRAFDPELSRDGLLTFPFLSQAPPSLAGRSDDATPVTAGTSVTIEFRREGETKPQKEPLKFSPQKDNVWNATYKARDDATHQALRTVLTQAEPAAQLIVERRVDVAALLTGEFVSKWWDNENVRDKLKSRLSLIEFGSAAMYNSEGLPLVIGSGDCYFVVECVYREEIPCPRLPGLVPGVLTWSNKAYTYYQDSRHPGRVYYLPDGFTLESPPDSAPDASFLRFKTPDGTFENMSATFRFYARPRVEPSRIEAARAEYRKLIGKDPEMLSVQSAKEVALKSKLFLYLPIADGTASKSQELADQEVNLADHIRGEVNLSFAAFQAVWNAIFAESPEQRIFAGWVDLDLQDGSYKDRVEFQLRLPKASMEKYFGEIYQIQETSDSLYKTLTFEAPRVLFEAPADDPVLALQIAFEDGASVELKAPPESKKTLTVKQKVASVVLGEAAPDLYSYTLTVIRPSGRRCAKKKTDKSASIWVTKADIDEKKTEPC